MTNKLTDLEAVKQDFRKFLWVIWQHLKLPPPTPTQYDIARYIQVGPNKTCVEAFRGVGKSFILGAYVLWILLRDPQKKILVVSASKTRADAFSTFCLRLIEEIPMLAHLKPKGNQRQSRVEFDVGPATADQSPSVKSVGIKGQLTGSRADIIIADDVEILNNSATADMREKLIECTREFSALLKPLDDARIIYLGTPQTEDSIYNKLPETFEIRIWPALVPTEQEAETYGDRLAPYIRKLMETREAGKTTDEVRFSDSDLLARRIEYGPAGFQLQFMLNTSLSDEDRYPLKVRDLIIMPIAKDRMPLRVEWMPDPKKEIRELPNVAMAGDRYYQYAGHSAEFTEFTGSVMSIDPSGRGKDETGYAVTKFLNGNIYCTRAGGIQGGYEPETLKKLAMIAKEENVNHTIIEANFGDGMYTQLYTPVVSAIHPHKIEEVKHSTQKERRIIDTLEPVISRHRLIFDPKVIEEDYRSANAYQNDNKFQKSLFYQMTRISYDKGALKHDDRLDALAMAVGFWAEQMKADVDRGISREKDAILQRDLDRFMQNAIGRKPASTNFNSFNW